MYQNYIIPYLYEAEHVSGETLPIIKSLKLTGSLWFFIRVVDGRCLPLHVQQPSTYVKPEAVSAVLGA
jgi:hypothetical protein